MKCNSDSGERRFDSESCGYFDEDVGCSNPDPTCRESPDGCRMLKRYRDSDESVEEKEI